MPDPQGGRDAEELREFARRYTAAWCSQDPARVAEHHAPEGSLTINGGARAIGRPALTHYDEAAYERRLERAPPTGG